MAYTIEEQNRTVSGSMSAYTVTRTFRITPYSEHPVAMRALLGTIYIVGKRIRRIPAATDPYFPWLRCTDVECTPFEALSTTDLAVSGINQFSAKSASESGIIKATYKTPTYDKDTGDSGGGGGGDNPQTEKDLATENWEFSYQNLILPKYRLKWKSKDPNIPNEPDRPLREDAKAVKRVPQISHKMTRHLCVTRPTQAIWQLLGRVNESQFRVNQDYYPAECLRFDSASASRKITNQGAKFYELTYLFTFLPLYDIIDYTHVTRDYVTWNRLYDDERGFWDRAVHVVDPNRSLYQLDTEIQQAVTNNVTTAGFDLLFDYRAV